MIAVGASSVKPPIEGCDLENVFFMRTPEDALRLRETVDGGNIKKAVVVGAGYIGLEIAENLKKMGVRPFVLDMAPQILSPGFDREMAAYAEGYRLIDASIQPTTEGATYVDLITVNGLIDGFDPDKKLLLVCNKGKSAYLLQNRMKFYGYKNTKALEGGNIFTDVEVEK